MRSTSLVASESVWRVSGRSWPRSSFVRVVAAAVVAALFGAFYFVPIVRLLSFGFVGSNGDLTLAPFSRTFSSEFYVSTILNTVRLSAIVTVFCLILAYPVSYLMAVARGRKFQLILICVMLPLWISVVVKTYAWLVILQQKGIVNSVLLGTGLIERPLSLVFGDFAVIIGSVHMMLPFMILPIYASLRRVDPALYRAATGLGARPAKAFWHVILPLTLPGIAAGGLIIFVLELGFFVTPAILGGGRVRMIAPIIQKVIESSSDWGVAAVLSVILLLIAIASVGISERLFRPLGGG